MSTDGLTKKNHQLRQLLQQQTQAAMEEAVHSDGAVSAERIESLDRLARLVELTDVAPSKPKNRWLAIGLVALTLLIVSILLFARTGETEIEFDLALSEVSFGLTVEQSILGQTGMNLSELAVSGAKQFELPRGRNRAEQKVSAFEENSVGFRMAVKTQQAPNAINLPMLTLPVNTRVTVGALDSVLHNYRLSLKGANAPIRVEVDGTVRVESPKAGIKTDLEVTAQPALVDCSNEECDLDLTFPATTKEASFLQLQIKDLSLVHLNQFTSDEQSRLHRETSSVLSGKIIFHSLNGQQLSLDPGELIRFDTSAGEIKLLRLGNDRVDLKFSGRVRGLRAGPDEASVSLMPTWLEWLRARHGLSLFWGTSLYLLGLLVSALRWWGKQL